MVVEHVGTEHTPRTVEDVRGHVDACWRAYQRFLPERRGILQASMLSQEFRRFYHDLRDRQVDIWAGHILGSGASAGPSAERARMSALAVVCLPE